MPDSVMAVEVMDVTRADAQSQCHILLAVVFFVQSVPLGLQCQTPIGPVYLHSAPTTYLMTWLGYFQK